jgi:hypothetical protein
MYTMYTPYIHHIYTIYTPYIHHIHHILTNYIYIYTTYDANTYDTYTHMIQVKKEAIEAAAQLKVGVICHMSYVTCITIIDTIIHTYTEYTH